MRKKRATVKVGICEDCGIETSISQRNLCADCSLRREQKIIKELQDKKGKRYEKWKQGMLRALMEKGEKVEKKKK